MTPRSEEFITAAHERLEASRALLDRELFGAAVSDGYYSILYAARAALSERDKNAKTHRGTWGLFYEEFVSGGSFDPALAREARATQESREGVDYGAARVSRTEAERVVDTAERFVAAVTALIDA